MKRLFSQWFSRWFGTHGVLSLSRRDARDQSAMANAPMLDCESVMRQLWDYLDGELTPEHMDAIRAHIEMCKRCYPQYEFERSFLNALAARQRMHSDPERFRTKLMASLRERGLTEA